MQLSEGYRVWFLGHSDGSQLAQLAALKFASEAGPERVGGVVTFGSSRVGSVGFAKFFNSVLGDKMVYFSYGRDPAANTDYLMSDVRVGRGEGGGEGREAGQGRRRAGAALWRNRPARGHLPAWAAFAGPLAHRAAGRVDGLHWQPHAR